MSQRDTAAIPPPPPRTLGQSLKQAGFFLLFSVILIVPRLRRLRRRPRVWTAIRAALAGAGAWLVWRFAAGDPGAARLALGIAVLLFALLVRAKPPRKTVDDLARVVGALTVLNGGTFDDGAGKRSRSATVLAAADRLYVLDAREEIVGDIPTAEVRRLSASPASPDAAEGGPWDVEVVWYAGAGERTARFHFEGYFAAHLARVMETTLRNLTRKELPVLK